MTEVEKILSDKSGWSVDAIRTNGPPISPFIALNAMKDAYKSGYIRALATFGEEPDKYDIEIIDEFNTLQIKE